eukprot:TRINITY_DN49594_c0_g1_i1.p1 TRINITY_DN49594_c0_g1~~TRINITY_DN49594_c0_g1_i1.p1  ORF type:complete len:352 (+),score=63.98 TRINITY_DN49594_c0_g1_i1:80-1135(+)
MQSGVFTRGRLTNLQDENFTPPAIAAAVSKARGGPPPLVPPKAPAEAGVPVRHDVPPVSEPQEPPAPKRAKKITTAFALMKDASGQVQVQTDESVQEAMEQDWKWFVQLAALASHDGTQFAVGDDAVNLGLKRGNVAVLFVSSSGGQEGERAARTAAQQGGRSYLVGKSNAIYTQLSKYGIVAVLRTARRYASGSSADDVQQEQEAAVSPQREFRRALKYLGTLDGLNDTQAIPNMADQVEQKWLPVLGAQQVFGLLSQAFLNVTGVGHRKAIVYIVHELLCKRKGQSLDRDDGRETCFKSFLKPIGIEIRAFTSAERAVYCKIVQHWAKRKVLTQREMLEVRDAWDIDEE